MENIVAFAPITQSQRQNRNNSKSGITPNHAQTESQILQKPFDGTPQPHFPRRPRAPGVLFPKIALCRKLSFIRCHPALIHFSRQCPIPNGRAGVRDLVLLRGIFFVFAHTSSPETALIPLRRKKIISYRSATGGSHPRCSPRRVEIQQAANATTISKIVAPRSVAGSDGVIP